MQGEGEREKCCYQNSIYIVYKTYHAYTNK